MQRVDGVIYMQRGGAGWVQGRNECVMDAACKGQVFLYLTLSTAIHDLAPTPVPYLALLGTHLRPI